MKGKNNMKPAVLDALVELICTAWNTEVTQQI
jgi:hypothetical protein